MGSPSEDATSADADEHGKQTCFRVKYLGCATFNLRKKRLPKGISSMQRPLLEVYSRARKKGAMQRGAHLFAMDQRLDVLEYGLVLAQEESPSKQPRSSSEDGYVLVKVLTPLSNAVLWAAVRFQARALRKRVLGAAFVPLACCDTVFEQDGYIRLDSKHRFLVSLSHPSVFSVVFRRVTDPRSFECHAFACGSAGEALALGSALSLARERCEMPAGITTRPPLFWHHQQQPPPPPQIVTTDDSVDDTTRRRVNMNSRRRRTSTRKHIPDSDESNSYASVHKFSARPQRNLFVRRRRVGRGSGGGSESSSGPKEAMLLQRRATPIGRSDDGHFNEWTPGSAPSSSVSFLSPSDESCSVDYKQRRTKPVPQSSSRKDVWTMTDSGVAEQEKTIDLSSEESSRSSLSGGGQQWTPLTRVSAPVKYTYFGYETFRAPTWIQRSASDDELATNAGNNMVTARNLWRPASGNLMNTSSKRSTNIVGNGTSHITINVPFTKRLQSAAHRRGAPGGRSSVASTQTDASSSCSNAVLLPIRGVRSFRSDRQVGDWSTLSQSTSDEASILQIASHKPRPCESSFSSSSDSNNPRRPGSQQRPHKMLRWSSEDRLPRRNGYAFFWSLKRLGVQSFTKAKYKTGKLFSSMRTKLMGSRKTAESSEDSAYDTSEVCLSPSGRTTCGRSCCTEDPSVGKSSSKNVKARRQQSWSFHDLRSLEDRPVEGKHRTLPVESHRPVVVVRKLADKPLSSSKRRTTRRKTRKHMSSASDSGVEEYPSDRCGSDRTDSDRRVTRVQVHHGMNKDTFHRWSHTNLQEELGYIP